MAMSFKVVVLNKKDLIGKGAYGALSAIKAWHETGAMKFFDDYEYHYL